MAQVAARKHSMESTFATEYQKSNFFQRVTISEDDAAVSDEVRLV